MIGGVRVVRGVIVATGVNNSRILALSLVEGSRYPTIRDEQDGLVKLLFNAPHNGRVKR